MAEGAGDDIAGPLSRCGLPAPRYAATRGHTAAGRLDTVMDGPSRPSCRAGIHFFPAGSDTLEKIHSLRRAPHPTSVRRQGPHSFDALLRSTPKRSVQIPVSGLSVLHVAALLAALLGGVTPAPAQNGSATDAIHEASARRDRRDYAGAATLLREHVATHPEDVHALRMLAQTLYWMGRVDAARSVYETGLTRFPADSVLRLDYARMLVETDQREHARTLLHPLRTTPLAADAEALLGTLAYWGGDLSAARKHFTDALRHDGQHSDARRQLDEIRQQSAPWITFGASLRCDDQPVEQSAGNAEVGMYLTPLHRLTVRAEPQRYRAAGTQQIVEASARWQGYWPRLRVETELGAGTIGRGVQPQHDWTGHAAAGLRLPQGFALRARVDRSPYHWTTSSLSTPVMTESAGGMLGWHRRGWLGEAGHSLQRFPDGNRAQSAHAWLLAPLPLAAPIRLQAGYGFSFQDAEESRFVPGAAPGVAGRYEPYYTPDDQRIHSAIGSLGVALGRALTLQASGAYGVVATEIAPPPDLTTAAVRRSHHPWNARASANFALSRDISVGLAGEHMKAAYYELDQWSAVVTYRFTPAPVQGNSR
jgi:tetratricopeptide (TPR) repeat protein